MHTIPLEICGWLLDNFGVRNAGEWVLLVTDAIAADLGASLVSSFTCNCDICFFRKCAKDGSANVNEK